jgi:hypothetical protein
MGLQNSKNKIKKESKLLKLRNYLLKEIFSFISEKERLKNIMKLNKRITKIILEGIKDIVLNGEKDNKFNLKYLDKIINCENIYIIHPKKISEYDLEKIFSSNLRKIKKINFNKIHLDRKLSNMYSYLRLRNLNILHIENCEFNLKGINILSQINLPNLLELKINQNKISDVFSLFQSEHKLRNLTIEILIDINHSEKFNFPQLKKIEISENEIRDFEIFKIFIPKLPNLIEINLNNNKNLYYKWRLLHRYFDSNFTKPNYFYFRIEEISLSLVNFPNIKILCLNGYNITNHGMMHLSKVILKNLEKLTLADNFIENNGMYHLSKADFPLLKYLSLHSNIIEDEGIKFLSQSKFKLEYLHLGNNKIGNVGLNYLSKDYFPFLKNLYLYDNRVCLLHFYNIPREKFPKIMILNNGLV